MRSLFVKMFISFILLSNLFQSLTAQTALPIYLDSKFSIDKRVENALSLMTLQEKVGLCHAQSKFSSTGVPRLGIPEISMSDGPHGIRAEMSWDKWEYAGWTSDSCTAFPSLNCLAASWNPSLAYELGAALGEEARYRNKSILLAPGVNIYRTPLNGRNFEYMGEDPMLASAMVVPYIKGVQINGVAACVKHYIANNQETLRGFINVEMSDRALNEIYLPAFKAAVVKGGVMAVMGAYNKFRGTYCNENPFLLNKVLKGDWNFKGVVVSDWNGIHSTMGAALGGVDIEMGTEERKSVNDYFLGDPFLEKLQNGTIDVKVVNDKARRILRIIFLTAMNRSRPFGSLGSSQHSDLSGKIAEQGIVLLKNEKNILPLAIDKIKTIAVIGDNATRKQIVGGGSSELKARYEISPLDGLKKRLNGKINVLYAQGYSLKKETQQQLQKEAIELASIADMVIFTGGLNKELGQDCESADRTTMELPYGQNELIAELLKVNKNIVVVLVSGNAVAMPWVNNVSAILQVWYPGMEGGNAIAKILCGDVNPSGKIPFTFPKKLADNPASQYGTIAFPGDGTNVEYKEDIYVGYRWFDTKKIKPLFPFGFGLSYTSFELGKMKLNKTIIKKDDLITIKLPVKNTGKIDGSEVVQLYLSQVNPTEDRPEKELKSFKKIFVESGKTQEAVLSISSQDFEYYSNKSKGWKLEPGMYKISVGNSSQNINEVVQVKVK